MNIPYAIKSGVLGACLAGVGVLAVAPAFAHVGQSSPARWLLRLEQTMKNGRPDTKKAESWKVPLATFNRRYDESKTNPLAQPVSSHPLPENGFTPLSLEIPPRYRAMCLLNPTLTMTDNSTGLLCDAGGELRDLAISEGAETMTRRRSWFGMWRSVPSPSCVTVSVQTNGCGGMSYSAPPPEWSILWGWSGGTIQPESGSAYMAGSTCDVTISGLSLGQASFTVDAAQLMSGAPVVLNDMWYYGRVPYKDGKLICQAGIQNQSCGSAGTPTACSYFGMDDAVANGINFPLTRDDIVSSSRSRMGILQGEAYGWMWGAMRKEQLMNGYFTHIVQDIALVNSTNNSRDINQWVTEPAEAQWTMYTDNTPAGAVNQAGRNSQGTYGDVLVRRYTPVVQDDAVQIGSGLQLLCRYISRPGVHVVPQWVLDKTGYLQCSLYRPPTQKEIAGGATHGTVVNENIFKDPANPDSEFGLNLHNQYDDLSQDDELFCAEAPELCVSPFEEKGGGTRLIQNVIRPLMDQWDAQSGMLVYGGAPSFTALNRLPADGVGGKTLLTTMTEGAGTASKLVSLEEPAGSVNLMMLGQSFRIKNRNVTFGACNTPITMDQTWTWDGQNAIPEYNWDVYSVNIPVEGGFQVVTAVNTGDGSVPEGNGLPATAAQDVTTQRSGIPVPLAVALSVPAEWKNWLSDSWKQTIPAGSILSDGTATIPGATTTWRSLFYPSGIRFMVDPGPGKHEGPYFVLNPMHYMTAHPYYYSVLDAHTYDGRDPLNAPALPDTLNHTFRDAPENGTVAGSLLQFTKTLKCETKGTSKCCIEWVTPDPVCDAAGKNCTQDPPYCAKFGEPYETCATYSCDTHYCDWNMAESNGGALLKWKEQDSCTGWSQLSEAIAAYASNLCVLPYTWDGAVSAPISGGNNPADYFQVKGEALKWK